MMAATGKLEQENLECDTCAKWKEKYLESQKQRRYLRECVNLYEGQFEKLKKAHEEDRSRADREKEEKLKETTRRVSLENEISTLRSQISLLQEKAGSGMPCGNEDLASLQIQISDSKMEIDRLKGVAEKEKKRADAMRKSAEEAKKEAAEAKNLADIEAKKAEEYRCQIEKLKTETDETRSKMALEISKFRDENKKLKVEKKRLFQEKKHADSEKLNVAERGKLVEANERLSKQLEELKNKIEELQEEKRKLMNSSRSTESPGVRDNILSSPMAKMKRLKKPAVSEKLKADEQKKLVEANQYLSKQVEEFKKKIDELQNKNHELINSRKLVEALRVSPDKVINSEMKSMKHLKKTLKLEKMRVKHAKLVAKLESERHNIVRQQLGCLKHEALQFLNRFYLLDDCFNHEIGDIDDPEKTEHLADVQRLISKRKFMEEDHCHMYGQRKHRRRDKTCKTMDASNHFSRIPECVPELLPISRGNSARSISGKGCFFCNHSSKIGRRRQKPTIQ